MKTCPSCHRPVPDEARACPHPGCGKSIAGDRPVKASGIRPPPPPRKIQLSSSDLGHPGSRNAAAPQPPGRRASRLLLLLLFCTLLGSLGAAIAYLVTNEQDADRQLATNDIPGANPANNSDLERAPANRPQAEEKKVEPGPQVMDDKAPSPPKETAADDERNHASQQPAKAPEAKPPSAEPELLGLYSQRTAPKRENWIGEYGGTPASEQAVAGGLDWLARHQADDGHWGPDCLGNRPGAKCEQDHPCSGAGGRYEAAFTGLAVLAFQAGGHYDFNDHQYSERVARGLHCLAEQQGFNGELMGSQNDVSEGPGDKREHFNRCYIYEHAIATFALAEACALAKAANHPPEPGLWKAAVKGVQFLESQQHDDGGWRYSSDKRQSSDTSVSGWAMLALKTAREAEIEVNSDTIPRLVAFFDKEEEPLTGRTHYQAPHFGTDALTGVGMMVDEFIKHDAGARRVRLAAPYLVGQAEQNWGPGARSPLTDYYLWYNCTLAMFQAGGEPWKRWNDVTRERVISLQEHGNGCTRGSWPPTDRWSADGGRIYSTALAVLTLEVYYRFAKEHLISEKPAQ